MATTYEQSVCGACGGHRATFSLKLVPTSSSDPRWPKFIPQIKASCDECGQYIKFAKQTPEMIETINALLAEVTW